MGIPNRTGSIFALSSVIALVFGLSSPPAFASTWSVSPGGTFRVTVQELDITDSATNAIITCGATGSTASHIKGTLRTGTGSGFHLGRIQAVTFQDCFMGDTPFTVTASNTPWYMNALSYASGVTTGQLTGIHLVLSDSNGCSAVVDGTSATANNGAAGFMYHNTRRFRTGPGSALHFYNVIDCGTVFNNNDRVLYEAISDSVTPPQTIMSP
jgi:hypothetical protein